MLTNPLRAHRRGLIAAAVITALAAGLTLVATTSAQAATLFEDTFEDANADGWLPDGGSWSVVRDDSYVYRQDSPVAEASSIAATSASGAFTVTSAEVKLGVSASYTGSAALLTRVTDASTYYYLAIGHGQLELGTRVDGEIRVLASTAYSAAASGWYRLTINTFLTDRVSGSVTGPDGSTASVTAMGSIPSTFGHAVGLATHNMTASFDNVRVFDDRIVPTSTAVPSASCSITFLVTSVWSTGSQTSVTVTNTGRTPISGWQVTWTFTGGQVIAYLWGGNWHQEGPVVTVTNLPWNGALAPGASTTFGFIVLSSSETGITNGACTAHA